MIIFSDIFFHCIIPNITAFKCFWYSFPKSFYFSLCPSVCYFIFMCIIYILILSDLAHSLFLSLYICSRSFPLLSPLSSYFFCYFHLMFMYLFFYHSLDFLLLVYIHGVQSVFLCIPVFSVKYFLFPISCLILSFIQEGSFNWFTFLSTFI